MNDSCGDEHILDMESNEDDNDFMTDGFVGDESEMQEDEEEFHSGWH